MPNKTKTIIKETEEVSERDNPAVIAYRVGQTELALNKLSQVLTESTEAHRQTSKELADKMDEYARQFVTRPDLETAQRESEYQHKLIDGRITEHGARISKMERNNDWIIKIVIAAVVVTLLTTIGLKAGFIH